MQAYTNTYKAIFPEPVEIPELGVTLAPITFAHFAAMEKMGVDFNKDGFTHGNVMVAAWMLSTQTPEDVMELFADANAAKMACREAAKWGLVAWPGHFAKFIDGVAKAIKGAYETAATPSDPPADGATERSSDGPSK